EGSGQGLNGLADLALGKPAVAERVEAPRGAGPLLHVLGEEGLDFLETAPANVVLELGYPLRVVLRQPRERFLGGGVAGIEVQGLSVGGRRARRVPALLEDLAQGVMGLGGVGLHLY